MRIHQISPLTGTLVELDSEILISNAGGPLENALVNVSQGEIARFFQFPFRFLIQSKESFAR